MYTMPRFSEQNKANEYCRRLLSPPTNCYDVSRNTHIMTWNTQDRVPICRKTTSVLLW